MKADGGSRCANGPRCVVDKATRACGSVLVDDPAAAP